MKSGLKVLGIIPARGGSKGIPKKNIVSLCNKPLIQYSIEAGLRASLISRTIVSTDSDEIKNISLALGAEVPFLRPKELSGDTTPALPVIQHAVQFFETHESWTPDIVVYLQATSPLRTSAHIDEAITTLKESSADCIVSVCKVPHHYNPYSVMKRKGEYLEFFETEGFNILDRKDKPECFARNGPALLGLKRNYLKTISDLYEGKVLPYIMKEEESIDIDSPLDLELAEFFLKRG